MDYYKRALELQDEVIANRRYLHEHPECSFALDNTVRFVKEKLTEMGYEPKDCGNHGVVALVGGKKGGPCVLLRADMDALAMKEESDLPFASKNPEAAHTCGHDAHTAMLLGAARILKEKEDTLCGTVKLVFQPAEEQVAGIMPMIKDHLLENPKVDAAFGIHIMAQEKTKTIHYNPGPTFASGDVFNILVTGKGGHGAIPQETIDPINVASHIFINLQTIQAREVAPSQNPVITIGRFEAGKASNVIPEQAFMSGTLRTYYPDVHDFAAERITEIAGQTASVFRAEAQVDFPVACPSLNCDPDTAVFFAQAARDILGEEQVFNDLEPYACTEDFAFISSRVPSAFFILGGDPGDREEVFGQHHPKVYFDEASFASGTALLAGGAAAWLRAHSK